MKKRWLAWLPILLLAVTGQTYASDTFQGSIWSLTYSGTPLADSDPLSEKFRIMLEVDTSGYTGSGSFLDQVAIKVASSYLDVSLFAAPSGTNNWSLLGGGINSGGCSGSGAGFVCADSNAALNGGYGLSVGGIYSWIFDVTVANGTLFTGWDQASVKGRFVDYSGVKVGDLVSENVTLLVPEPEIYAMMGVGLGLLGFIGRRRRRAT